MNYGHQLAARLQEVERIHIRRSNSEAAILAAYHDFKSELSGGHLRGGTEEQGIEEMREVFRIVYEDFRKACA